MPSEKFLITGFGRSGTKYMSHLLKLNGIDAPHEKIGKNGCVSWLHIVDGDWTSKIKILPKNFHPILHQVREPIKVISSAMTIRQHSINFMKKELDVEFESKDKLFQIMYLYHEWNRMIEEKASYRYRIEDINKELPNILSFLGFKERKLNFDLRKDINTRKKRYKPLNKDDLLKCSPKLFKKIERISKDYGY